MISHRGVFSIISFDNVLKLELRGDPCNICDNYAYQDEGTAKSFICCFIVVVVIIVVVINVIVVIHIIVAVLYMFCFGH